MTVVPLDCSVLDRTPHSTQLYNRGLGAHIHLFTFSLMWQKKKKQIKEGLMLSSSLGVQSTVVDKSTRSQLTLYPVMNRMPVLSSPSPFCSIQDWCCLQLGRVFPLQLTQNFLTDMPRSVPSRWFWIPSSWRGILATTLTYQ